MAEELVLTDPVTESKTTTKYHIRSVTLDMYTVTGQAGQEPGLLAVMLRSDIHEPLAHAYVGDEAVALIRQLNTANLTTKSLNKRILEKLAADGIIPGTVTGTPDPV